MEVSAGEKDVEGEDGVLKSSDVVKSKWSETNPETDLNEQDKRKLLALVVKIATRLIFRHHCYQFDGTVYRQRHGGPIGLRFTSVVACIVMDFG